MEKILRNWRKVEKIAKLHQHQISPLKVITSLIFFSVMFSATASGDLLPPMVVYKAKNCYQECTVDGPEGVMYASISSDWFDGDTFTQWFNAMSITFLCLFFVIVY